MHLNSISVSNYKNIKQAELVLSPKINCFLGNNGEGKTNFLDAVYYLSFCKNYINSVDTLNINHEEDFFVLNGEYERNGNKEVIYCGLQRKTQKLFKRNKKKYSRLSEHIGLLPLVMLSPIDSKLILDGSDERRKYIDSVISLFDKQYLNDIISYNKVLNQRNTYLKQSNSSFFDNDLLSVWDEQLNSLANIIYEKRDAYINELIPVFQKYYSFISGNKEKVNLTYKTDITDGELIEQLKNTRTKDLAIGYTTKGIHKDDLLFLLDEYPIKRLGSQGQQKTYLTALKFAQYEFISIRSNLTPILLLDDVFDKLDSNRVEKIVELVSGNDFGQIFMTDTNRDHLYDLLEKIGKDHKVFFVENGEIEQR